MKAVIVVPWRGGDPVREANWRYTRHWWERFGYEVLQVTHSGPEPFNRAWCINEGARRAWPWDVLVMIDADVVEGTDEQVTQMVIRAWETGRFTVGHTEGRDLNQRGTKWVLDGGTTFDWHAQTREVRAVCDSRVNAIRSDTFEALGGFDTRFRGWGHEDVAFTEAARKLNGELERIPGSSWHLYHDPMYQRSRRTQEWQMGRDLAARYQAADAEAIVGIMRERSLGEMYVPPFPEAPPARIVGAKTDLVVLTSGRAEYLRETLASADKHLRGTFAQRWMFDDSGDPAYGEFLDVTYGNHFTIIHNASNTGYASAMASARQHVRDAGGAPYVFWLEDDFVFLRDIDVDELATCLERPGLAQIVLLREPYYGPELEKGSIPNEHPASYTREVFRGIHLLSHKRFYSSNPNLAKRELYDVRWPVGRGTEQRMGKLLVRQGFDFAYLGWGDPQVRHIGEVRGGHGY